MTIQIEATGCLLCHETAGDEPSFSGLVRRCLSCGFHWTAAGGGGAAQPDLFDGSYYHDYFARAGQWRYEAARRLRWLRSAVHPASLLEAGSAGGYFLEAAQQAGITATGAELSEVCVNYARDQLNVSARHGCFETLAPTAATEAVCAFHVLEHVDDPRGFLTTARRALTAGGWLALEVPNIASAAAHRWGGSWPHLQPGCHRWHFSPQSLTRLVEECGFHVERCDTVSSRYYMRPRRWLSPAGVSMLLADWAACGSPRTTHPRLGDHIRLLARLPKGPVIR
ncbi:class I SAM-dependent methyltransferase [Streptomyces sp. H10-C2]|uniref:class I SAM-dependent methyltransferase n=1 Tax=unclassified Streptomyces TaxID=2593676 RepID=UPI0024B8D1AA|nr:MULTISPECIES: class I SAM-dependent methyltransferase [unclassified Streptomyces]MDJ0341179.1 class I SAM-dependent methyltransferase [Streptomyces sp. PH10-H1]MDJ0369468.1 class I SAM-dependent methyltransferase [Streptomyces sp. H10-C2]